MYTLYTKANRLMAPNQFNVEPHNILCNDVILPGELDEASRYNPYNVRLWLIGHMYGPVAAVFASNEQDALDAACNLGKMECFMLSEEDSKAYYEACDNDTGESPGGEDYTPLGNAGELHSLEDCWLAEVELIVPRDIKLIVKLARASEGGHDTLDF